ncbi:MAG: DUF1698 domain-containing protein [Candidatus Hermodarchaeota archaeon]
MLNFKTLLKKLYNLYFRVYDPLRIAELEGERVVFKYLKDNNLLEGLANKRILEIGPKHGKDSVLLASLNPSELILIDLPEKSEYIHTWLPAILRICNTKYIEGNILYLNEEEYQQLGKFDLIFCLGVLYHNVEQIRLLKRLYKLCNLDGLIIVESSTTRNRKLEKNNVVEICWPKQYRNIPTITHLPSRLAIKSWLEMVGFMDVTIHNVYSRALRWQRAVITGIKTEHSESYMNYGAYSVGDAH